VHLQESNREDLSCILVIPSQARHPSCCLTERRPFAAGIRRDASTSFRERPVLLPHPMSINEWLRRLGWRGLWLVTQHCMRLLMAAPGARQAAARHLP